MGRSSILFSISLFIISTCIISACSTTDSKNTEKLQALAKEQGDKIAMETQKVLGGTLKSVIKNEGIPPALKYCNVQAYPLVDSLERKYQVSIKRASTFTRNPKDMADKEEQKIIESYQSALNAGETPEVYVEVSADEVHFAKPIILNDQVCLKCHGEVGTEIQPKHYEVIKALYPDDNATGHKLGDLRGIWSIRFDKSTLAEMENQ